MLIYMRDNQLETITYQEDPKAKLYPPDQIPADQLKLNGFLWLMDKRPKKKEDIFNWDGSSVQENQESKVKIPES